jgi:hypothetical protein
MASESQARLYIIIKLLNLSLNLNSAMLMQG